MDCRVKPGNDDRELLLVLMTESANWVGWATAPTPLPTDANRRLLPRIVCLRGQRRTPSGGSDNVVRL
jgi:hypothetical protein